MTLTEQWKKGELPYGYYYIKTISGGEVIDRYYRDCTDYDLCEYGDVWENRFEDEIQEVLAPVPTYEEWQQLHKFLEEFNALEVAEENQQLKELIKEIRSLWKGTICMPDSQEQVRDILTKIDNVIGAIR